MLWLSHLPWQWNSPRTMDEKDAVLCYLGRVVPPNADHTANDTLESVTGIGRYRHCTITTVAVDRRRQFTLIPQLFALAFRAAIQNSGMASHPLSSAPVFL